MCHSVAVGESTRVKEQHPQNVLCFCLILFLNLQVIFLCVTTKHKIKLAILTIFMFLIQWH